MADPIVCDDCGDEVRPRRRRCVHCGMLVCGFCFGHEDHDCGPGHTKAECRDIAALREMSPEKRRAYLRRLRTRALMEAASNG